MPETATKTKKILQTNHTENKKTSKEKKHKGNLSIGVQHKKFPLELITNQADVAKREEQRENKKNRLLRTRCLEYHP
jgi:hypothetical protein